MPAHHRSWWRDLRLALGFMTRLPVGVIEGDLAAASWAFPLAGLLGGRRRRSDLRLRHRPRAVGAHRRGAGGGSAMLLTGALHEDGLADFADGLGVRGGPAERLAAMRASGIGSFGTLALVFGVLLRVAALAALVGPAGVGPALLCSPCRGPGAAALGHAWPAAGPGRRPGRRRRPSLGQSGGRGPPDRARHPAPGRRTCPGRHRRPCRTARPADPAARPPTARRHHRGCAGRRRAGWRRSPFFSLWWRPASLVGR